jgi:hypothetical protein
MALVDCPKCGGKVSTRIPRCPQCGTARVEPRTAVRARPANLEWAKTWAIVSGCFLVAGFLIPVPVPQYNGYGALWTWDLFEFVPLVWMVGLVAPPVGGVAALAAVAFAPARMLGPLMACLGGLVVGVELFQLILVGAAAGQEFGLRISISLLAIALAIVGAFGIAAANHIRKVHPSHAAPRVLSGICGLLVILFFVLPLGTTPAVVSFFDGSNWKRAWPVMLGLLACLEYGIVGVIGFKRFADPAKACDVISIVGRVVFALVPLSYVLLWFFVAPDEAISFRGLAPVALTVLKVFLSVYGVLILPWAGITATVIGSLKREHPPQLPDPPGVPSTEPIRNPL